MVRVLFSLEELGRDAGIVDNVRRRALPRLGGIERRAFFVARVELGLAFQHGIEALDGSYHDLGRGLIEFVFRRWTVYRVGNLRGSSGGSKLANSSSVCFPRLLRSTNGARLNLPEAALIQGRKILETGAKLRRLRDPFAERFRAREIEDLPAAWRGV
jgi:hypothetical protein